MLNYQAQKKNYQCYGQRQITCDVEFVIQMTAAYQTTGGDSYCNAA